MWTCPKGRKQFPVKAGTILDDSPIGVDKWLCAMWMLANCKNGVSSYEIGRALGVTQKTAWFMLHRIRYAQHHGSINKMTGTVEATKLTSAAKARNIHKDKRAEKIHERGPEVRRLCSACSSAKPAKYAHRLCAIGGSGRSFMRFERTLKAGARRCPQIRTTSTRMAGSRKLVCACSAFQVEPSHIAPKAIT